MYATRHNSHFVQFSPSMMFKSFSIHASVKKLRKKVALLNKVICKMLEWSVSNAVNQIIGNKDEKRIMTDLIPRAD